MGLFSEIAERIFKGQLDDAASKAPQAAPEPRLPEVAPTTGQAEVASPASSQLPSEGADKPTLAEEVFTPPPPERDVLLKDKYGIDPPKAPWQENDLTNYPFNQARIEADADVRVYMEEAAARNPELFQEYTRGVQKLSDIEARAQAGMLGFTTDEFRALRALKAEDMTKAGYMVQDMAAMVKRQAIIARDSSDPKEALKLRLMEDDFVEAIAQTKGLITETARTQSAMRITKKSLATARGDIQEMIDQYGGFGFNKRVASVIADLEDPAEISRAIQKTSRATAWDMFWEGYQAMLLTSPQTLAVNMLGSTGAYVYQAVPESMAAYAVGLTRQALNAGIRRQTPEGMYWQEVIAGMPKLDTIAAGYRRAWKALKTGDPADETTKLDPQVRRRAITAGNVRGMIDDHFVSRWATEVMPGLMAEGNWTQKAFDLVAEYGIRGSYRAMITADEFNRGMAYQSYMKSQAVRAAIEEGTPKAGFDQRVNDLLANHETLLPGAAEGGEELGMGIAFQTPLTREATGLAKGLQNLIYNEPPIVREGIPSSVAYHTAKTIQAGVRMPLLFMKTMVNLTKWTMQRGALPNGVPTGIFMPSFWSDMQKGGRHADLALARVGLGTAVSMSLYNMTGFSDYSIGSGPTNTRIKQHNENLGHQPYSVVIPQDSMIGKAFGQEKDISLSIKRADPFARTILLARSIQDVQSYATQNERELLVLAYVSAVTRQLGDMTFAHNFGALSDAFEGVRENRPDAMENYLADLITGPVVPAGAAWVGRQTDPDKRLWKDTDSERSKINAALREAGIKEDTEMEELFAFAEKTINKIKARSPGFGIGVGKDVPALKDYFGNSRGTSPGLWFDIMPLYKKELEYSTQKLEDLGIPPVHFSGVKVRDMGFVKYQKFLDTVGPSGEFIRLGWAPGNHGESVGGVPLTPRERYDYIEAVTDLRPADGYIDIENGFGDMDVLDVSGMNLKEAMTALMRTEVYFNAVDDYDVPGSKPRLISRVQDAYRHDFDKDYDISSRLGGADLVMFLTHPNLANRVMTVEQNTLTPEQLDQVEGLVR